MIKHLSPEYKAIFKDIPPKENKIIKETMDKEKFYKVVDGIFYIPSIYYIKQNMTDLAILDQEFKKYYYSKDEVLPEWCLKNNNCNYYKDEDDILNCIKQLKTKKLLAVDIETDSLNMTKANMLLIIFAWSENDVVTFSNFTPRVIEELKELLTSEKIKFLWHNGKFDISILNKRYNIKARVDHDTMLLHYSGFNGIRGTHGLKYLSMLHLNAPNWEKPLEVLKKQICRENKIKLADFNYSMFKLDDLVKYAYFDGLATFRLFNYFIKNFSLEHKFIYDKLIEAANIFAEIEQRGAYVDLEVINKLEKELEDEHDFLMGQINNHAKDYWDPKKYVLDTEAGAEPKEFNVGSPKQLKWLLGEMGYKLGSTDVKSIEKINSDFTNLILEVRTNNIYRKTYVKGLKNKIDDDGRIRTTYNLHGTITGRLSSSGPNLQNIPRDKRIKNIFRSTPGYKLIGADYSQAELRMLAFLSDDEWLKNVYVNSEDLHAKVAEQYFGKDYTSEDRVKAKTVNFGIAYGVSAMTLAPNLNIPLGEAKRLLADWFVPMPLVKKYLNTEMEKPMKGKPITTLFGRKREFVVTPKNKKGVAREASNMQIQSMASDLTLFSILEIHKELKKKDLGYLILTVHDSIICEALPENVDKVKKIMNKHMQGVSKIYLKTDIPFIADTLDGIYWGEVG